MRKRPAPKKKAVGYKDNLTKEDIRMFDAMRIPRELLHEAGVRRITDEVARTYGFSTQGDLDGLFFPYATEEEIVNARIRRDNPVDNAGEPNGKYVSKPKPAPRMLYMIPSDRKRVVDDTTTEVILVEAEKSALAITAANRRLKKPRNLVAAALGGCTGWHDRISKDESRPLADLDILRGRTVYVMLDSNVAANDAVKREESKLAAHLAANLRARVACLRVPPLPGVNGPDDFIAKKKTDAAFWELFKKPVEPWLTSLGHSWEEYSNAKPPEFLVKGFLQEEGVTFITGLAGEGKTWLLLSLVQSLLSGEALFGYGHFATKKVKRVLYITPEVGLGAVKKRIELCCLGNYIRSGQLIVHTFSAYPPITLDDPNLLLAARDSIVILDTAVRFLEGELNSATDNAHGFASKVFALLGAGARSIVVAHHAPKAFSNADSMSLQNTMLGTGDLGATASAVWGVRRVDPEKLSLTQIYVENVKARDFEPGPPFRLIGKPHINEGHGLRMDLPPGECGYLSDHMKKPGRPLSDEKKERKEKLAAWAEQGKTAREMFEMLKAEGATVSLATVEKDLNSLKRAAKAKF